METVQQNGRFTLFSSKFLSIYSIIYVQKSWWPTNKKDLISKKKIEGNGCQLVCFDMMKMRYEFILKKIKDFVNNVIEVKADKSRYKVNPEENINNLFVKCYF